MMKKLKQLARGVRPTYRECRDNLRELHLQCRHRWHDTILDRRMHGGPEDLRPVFRELSRSLHARRLARRTKAATKSYDELVTLIDEGIAQASKTEEAIRGSHLWGSTTHCDVLLIKTHLDKLDQAVGEAQEHSLAAYWEHVPESHEVPTTT